VYYVYLIVYVQFFVYYNIKKLHIYNEIHVLLSPTIPYIFRPLLLHPQGEFCRKFKPLVILVDYSSYVVLYISLQLLFTFVST